MVADSKPDEVNAFISICLIIPNALDAGVYLAFNRNFFFIKLISNQNYSDSIS
jgi:hypothetical protein